MDQLITGINRSVYRAAVCKLKGDPVYGFIKSIYLFIRQLFILLHACDKLLLLYNTEYLLCIRFSDLLVLCFRMNTTVIDCCIIRKEPIISFFFHGKRIGRGIIHTAAINRYRADLRLQLFSRCIILIGKQIKIIECLISACGFLFYTASVSKCHSRTAHWRIGYRKKTYGSAASSEPFDLALLADNFQKSFCILKGEQKGAKGRIVFLLFSHIAACGKKPVFVLLLHRKRIHRVSSRTVIKCKKRTNLIGCVFLISAAAQKSQKQREHWHDNHPFICNFQFHGSTPPLKQ